MRFKYIKLLISIPAFLLLLESGNPAFAQVDFGKPTKSTPAPNKTTTRTRKRHTSGSRRAPSQEASKQPEDTSGGTGSTKPADPLPTTGVEEKKQGLEAFNKGDFDSAIAKLNVAANLRSADAEIFYYLGDAYSEKKDYEKAIPVYEKAIKINESAATGDNYFSLGYAYEMLKNESYDDMVRHNTEALRAYQKANAKKPGSSETLTHLGDVSSKLKQWEPAVDYYQSAAKVDADIKDPDVFFNWGVAYMNGSRNYEAAVPRFTRAIELNVDNIAEAYYYLGFVCRATARYPDAVAAFQKQLEKKNDDTNAALAYEYLGGIYGDHLSDWQAAANASRNAVALNSKDQISWNNLGTAEYNLQHFPQAVEAYLKAATLLPNEPEFQFNLGKAYRRVDRYGDAVEAFTKAIQLKPRYGEAYYFRGLNYRLQNQFEQAVESLNTALEIGLEPTHEANARYLLAISYFKLGNTAASRQQCDLLKTNSNAPPDSERVCRP